MIKFNDNSITTGYIKQLLKSFNLPTVSVFDKTKPVFKSYVSESTGEEFTNLYIYNGQIVKFKKTFYPSYIDLNSQEHEGDFDSLTVSDYIKVTDYTYNTSLLNLTKNLKLNSLIYDSYTHEYLGNYLRFLRDYKDLNLMSLYNCFSNNQIDEINSTVLKNMGFDTGDTRYKYYIIPVKLFEQYTLSIESIDDINTVCIFYNNKLLENLSLSESSFAVENFYELTKTTIKTPRYKDSYLYTKLSLANLIANFDEQQFQIMMRYKDNLKLLIKVPVTTVSSITVLEGNYLGYNDFIFSSISNKLISYNKSIPNIESSDLNKNLISRSQLMQMNSGVSYPYADRLIEYLTNNAITQLTETSDNIKRIQQTLHRRYENAVEKGNESSGIKSYKQTEYGFWQPYYRNVVYDVARYEQLLDEKFDILGYIDKDIENKLGKDYNIYDIIEK